MKYLLTTVDTNDADYAYNYVSLEERTEEELEKLRELISLVKESKSRNNFAFNKDIFHLHERSYSEYGEKLGFKTEEEFDEFIELFFPPIYSELYECYADLKEVIIVEFNEKLF